MNRVTRDQSALLFFRFIGNIIAKGKQAFNALKSKMKAKVSEKVAKVTGKPTRKQGNSERGSGLTPLWVLLYAVPVC